MKTSYPIPSQVNFISFLSILLEFMYICISKYQYACMADFKRCLENKLPLRSIYVIMPSKLITSNVVEYGIFSSGCIHRQDIFSSELVKIEGR